MTFYVCPYTVSIRASILVWCYFVLRTHGACPWWGCSCEMLDLVFCHCLDFEMASEQMALVSLYFWRDIMREGTKSFWREQNYGKAICESKQTKSVQTCAKMSADVCLRASPGPVILADELTSSDSFGLFWCIYDKWGECGDDTSSSNEYIS